MPLGKTDVKEELQRLLVTIADKLSPMLPVLTVLSIALSIACLSTLIDAPRISIVPFFGEGEIETILLNVSFFVSIISLSIFFIYYILRKGYVSLLEKAFGIGGGLLTLSLSGFFSVEFLEVFPFLSIFLMILIPLLIIVSMIYTIFGIFPEETRTIIYMMYSSVTGSVLGMGTPKFSMVFILLSACTIDLVSYRTRFLKRLADLSEGEAIFLRLRYSGNEVLIGWGDLVFCSMFTSYSFVNFGPLIAILSTFMILVGWIVTFFLTARKEILPGLPVPMLLGLIPVMLSLNPFYTVFLAIPLVIDRFVLIIPIHE